MEVTTTQALEQPVLKRVFFQKALYPNHYVWFVFLSTLDVLLTAMVMQQGGREANALAAWLLMQYGVFGLVMLKFTAVPIVIGLCQTVGRLKPPTGRRLTEWVVALSAIPVVLGFFILITRKLMIL